MDNVKKLLTLGKGKNDGDIVDALIYRMTVTILVIFSVVVLAWSLFGTPIQCWFPKQFTGFWNEYALDYCYVQNTYFDPMFNEKALYEKGRSAYSDHWLSQATTTIGPSKNATKGESRIIGYYQWVPFVLALMAGCFYFPSLLWECFYSTMSNGDSIFVNMQKAVKTLDAETRRKHARAIGVALRFENRQFLKSILPRATFFCDRTTVSGFVTVKLICTLICVGQFFGLELFLGLKTPYWGWSIFNDLYNNREWTETGNFPRVTFCNFSVRSLGNIKPYTVQCVLLINMVNEKIFIFLWFWFALIAVLSALSLTYWSTQAVCATSGRRDVLAFLRLVDSSVERSGDGIRRRMAKQFVADWWDYDSLFILRLIRCNVGDAFCRDVIESMWQSFKLKNANYFKSRSLADGDNDATYDPTTLPSKARLTQRGK